MARAKGLQDFKKGVTFFCLFANLSQATSKQVRYSIPEETEKGSFVGNIARDLGLDAKELSDHGIRIVSPGRTPYFALNYKSGNLLTTGRIDREELCGQMEKCILNFEIIVEDSMKIYGVEVEITDINDHAPTFPSEKIAVNMSELTALGTQFPLMEAQDPDLGNNSLQGYKLSSNSHFSLNVQTTVDGKKYTKLVLGSPLDREKETMHNLVLMAYDGGDPFRTGSVPVLVTVMDANDNAPIFSQPFYKVNVREDIPMGSTVVTLKATDLDEGTNKEMKYSFRKFSPTVSQMFHLDATTGEVALLGNLDYENSALYEIEVQVQDGGGLLDRATLVIFVTDVNDNAPKLEIASLVHAIPENSPPAIAIALINVQDQDSGDNAEVTCSLPSDLPFQLTKSYGNYYSLMTTRALDREHVASYNITITATDRGNPPLSTSILIPLEILDTNDSPPHFRQSIYATYLMENNPRGASILSIKADDPDFGENSKVTYSVVEGSIGDSSISFYISVNSETGVIYALNSFDYERIQELSFLVKAQDGGSPPLSSNVSVTLFILDQNDNAPEILYPSPPIDGSTGIELAPRSSEPGYLVTKVVAVDADSGQNAWLSYQLTKATEPGLFTVGLHTGEIRTARFFLEKDVLKQSLVILVKDNGQPSLSASVTMTVALADNIPEILSDLSSISSPIDPPSDLTFYLVVAVAFVSCLFFTFLLVLLAIRLHRWRNSQLLESGSLNLSGVPVSQFVGIDGVRAFLHSYCHEVSLTRDSRKNQFNTSKTYYSNTLTNKQSSETKDPFLVDGDINSSNEDSANKQVSYHYI